MIAVNTQSQRYPVARPPFARRLFYSDHAGWLASFGFLVLRLVMGVAFVIHGWPKIHNPFGWMGEEGPFPGVLLALAALAEFGGGAALVIGFLTRLAALGIMANMIVAIAMIHVPKGDPFVAPKGGPSFELAAIYLACAILLLLAGAGRFSFDALLFGRTGQIVTEERV